MAHRVHLETPHTIPYTRTHTNSSPDDAWGEARGGWWWVGDQALIIIKGPMICFLQHLEEHGSHLNEYQINTLKSLWHTLDSHIDSTPHNNLHTTTQKKKEDKLRGEKAGGEDAFMCVCSTEKQPQGSFVSLKMSKYITS